MIDDDDRVRLEVWSDVACPWCFVGRRNLGIALADLDERERPVVTWRAYQLDPTIPRDGAEADAYFTARFGDLEQFEQARENLVHIGEELGIDFRFDRQRVVPNTHLAHRMIAAAAQRDLHEPVLDAIFAAYFERGVDIGNAELLEEVVADAIEAPDVAATIRAEAEADADLAAHVDADIAQASQLGITGVPCFVADRRIAVPGAVPPQVLAQLVAKAAAAREHEATEDDD